MSAFHKIKENIGKLVGSKMYAANDRYNSFQYINTNEYLKIFEKYSDANIAARANYIIGTLDQYYEYPPATRTPINYNTTVAFPDFGYNIAPIPAPYTDIAITTPAARLNYELVETR